MSILFLFCSTQTEIVESNCQDSFHLYDAQHGSVAQSGSMHRSLKTDEGLYPSVSSNLTAPAKFNRIERLGFFYTWNFIFVVDSKVVLKMLTLR